MNIRLKLAIFFAVGIGASIFYYIKFGQNINDNGLLNFIGIPTIIAVAICHGIAFLIRLLLVRRHCRSLGVTRGNEAWLSGLSITNGELFSKIQKSFNRAAALFFLSITVPASAMSILFFSLKNMSDDEVGRLMEQHRTAYASLIGVSFASIPLMLYFAVHFTLMSSFLEYKSKVKALFITIASFIIVTLSVDYLFKLLDKLWGR